MVICHAGVGLNNPGLCMFIYAFHMPVFFMISGYFEKNRHKVTLKQKLLKNIRSFIVPYLVFNLFAFTYCWYGMLNHPELNHNITASQIVPNGLLGIVTFQLSQTDHSFLPNGVLWFLISLLQCKLLFMLTTYLYRRSKVVLSCVISILILVALYFISNRIETFVIGPTLLAFPFYVFGYITKRSSVIEKLSENYSFGLSILCFILLVVLVPLNGRPDIASVWFGNSILLFYLNAIIGSLMCITFAKCLSEIPTLMYLGKNTLSVLCVHVFFVMIGKRVIDLLKFIPSYSFLYCFLVSLFSVTASLMMGAYIMRRWPWMLGKWKDKKSV